MTVTTFQFTCKKDDTHDVVGIARELCGASGPIVITCMFLACNIWTALGVPALAYGTWEMGD